MHWFFPLLYIAAILSHCHTLLVIVTIIGVWHLWITFLKGYWPHIFESGWFWLADFFAAIGFSAGVVVIANVTIAAFALLTLVKIYLTRTSTAGVSGA